jgi:N-acyl-D-aspartate/D-glutamate deacylase
MSYDLVIRGGTIVDGSGRPRYRADIGILGDRIAEIGRISGRGAKEIDAEGHIVSPGFIDGHSHFDAQVSWDPLGTSSCWHGVTSVVMGNCGFSLAPARAAARALVVRNLERAEDISAKAMEAGIKWRWETFPEYLDAVEALPKGINYSGYVGHSALRTWAMGERAFEQEANEDDLARMQTELRAAIKAGAMGLSTSRSLHHETSDDRPVASRQASWDEVRTLVGTMGGMGGGVFELAHEPDTRHPDPEIRAASLGRLRDLAVATQVPITFGIVVGVNPSREIWHGYLDLLDSTAKAGGTMFGQTHSRDVTALLSFRTQLPFDKLPLWRELRVKPLAEQARLLRDPEMKAKLVDIATNGPYGRAIGVEARKPNWDAIQLFDTPLPPHPTMADLAKQRGTDPVTLMIDLSLESDFNCFFMQFLIGEDQDGLLEIMRHPHTVMTFSDTGAHVSQISDCSIQTHMLAWWVRERQAFTLEEAVRLMTQGPAKYWGFRERGLLGEGMIADINVFDAARVTPLMPEVVHDLPGGAVRLIQRADGFLATIVAGEILLKNGRHTGALPGRLLRGELS